MSASTIVTLVTISGALFLAMRGLRSNRPSFGRVAAMAAAWVIIIAALAYVLHRSGV